MLKKFPIAVIQERELKNKQSRYFVLTEIFVNQERGSWGHDVYEKAILNSEGSQGIMGTVVSIELNNHDV